MNVDISERAFEDVIERALLRHGPDEIPYDGSPFSELPHSTGDLFPGGYRKRRSEDYHRTLCLIPRDLLDFVLATQPKEWRRYEQQYGTGARDQFVGRVSSELDRRGTLDVLRNGIKDAGCKFRLAFFRPASGLNDETKYLYSANQFAVVRQLRYSASNEKSLDLVLFLNGMPIFTAELKNPLSGQTVQDAVRQYRNDRDFREPLLAYRRCLAHFAVDVHLVYVTTRLHGAKTRFLPFNQGWDRGAGNPPVTPTRNAYATAYLWEEIWARDSILDLIRQFIQEVEDEDDDGKKTGRQFLIFPRYQQIDCVRKLIADAREHGAGRRYLIQHSAGSGKSLTIGWLAHQLATLHDADDRRVFDSIIVVTDRRVLDRQLQATMRQLEQTLGVVENIDTTARQLKEALEAGKTIIVTTLQKFPVIVRQIGDLPGKRFAVIVDEAHSSQAGESTKSLKAVLAVDSLESAAEQESAALDPAEELEETIAEEMRLRSRLPNLSTFAFTATPKQKTLELFGVQLPDSKFEPFHLYSMRQAIDEGFILDVLENYTTYGSYWRLLKTIEDDPHYDKRKASFLLRSFVNLHPHAINEKVCICVKHFAAHVRDRINGTAKAMIVTRSRLHAVRYKLAFDRIVAELGLPFKALIAFSGTVEDGGKSYTEAGMNGVSTTQTAKTFNRFEYRFLIVANKFQTGFDQPLLHTMYVDKKLVDVNAVQTLSRLNRTHPEKHSTMVIDFANEADDIKNAFTPHYETAILSEAMDPNILYSIQGRLAAFPVFTENDIDSYARVFFSRKSSQEALYAALAPLIERIIGLSPQDRDAFRSDLAAFGQQYAFLSQVVTFADPDLEKFHVFARHLRKLIPANTDSLPREVQQNIDMESYRLRQTTSGKIPLERGIAVLEPVGDATSHSASPDESETLSAIISELNERFGLDLGPEYQLTLEQMMRRLDEDAALDATARVNTLENVRLAFNQKVDHVIQDIVDENFELFKKITNDPGFGDAFRAILFDAYIAAHRNAEALIRAGESLTVEFKSTLRWNLKEDRKDDKAVTHAVLKTVAAFLNTKGGHLLIGVADDGAIIGTETDKLDTDDKFMRHLTQVVRNGLGDRAGTCIDPKMQVVDDKTVCVVDCSVSPEPVFLKWKQMEAVAAGDFFVRSGPSSIRLDPESTAAYVSTRFIGASTAQVL